MHDDFGKRLKNCLKNAGYTQIKATEELNLSKNAIFNYTKGRIPEAKILYELSELCNVSMEYLLTGKENYNELSENEKLLVNDYRKLNNKYKIIAEYKIKELIKENSEEVKFHDIG